jgi:hypothetical protein
MSIESPIIGYTLGDQAGIGPEVIAAALKQVPQGAEYKLIGKHIPCTPGHPTQDTAEAALEHAAYDRCAALLTACEEHSLLWHYVTARMHFAQNDFSPARPHFEAAWELDPKTCCSRLEDCCRRSSI